MPARDIPDSVIHSKMGMDGFSDHLGHSLFGRGRLGVGKASEMADPVYTSINEFDGRRIKLDTEGFSAGDLCILYTEMGWYERVFLISVGADSVLVSADISSYPNGNPRVADENNHYYLAKVMEYDFFIVDDYLKGDFIVPITARQIILEHEVASDAPSIVFWAESIIGEKVESDHCFIEWHTPSGTATHLPK